MRTRHSTFSHPVAVLAGILALATASGGCKRSGPSTAIRPNAVESPKPLMSESAPLVSTKEEPTNEPVQFPPTPDIAMDVNSATELKLYQGVPMIVSVRLANQRASNVVFQNAALAADNKASKSQPVPVVQLASRWSKFIRFEIRTGRGAEPLAWPLLSLGGEADQPAALDGTTNPEVQWGLSPEAAARVSPGVYRIVAVLEVAAGDAANWRGRVESAPVVLTIEARPASFQGPGAAESDMAEARYWAHTRNWDKSLAAAESALRNDPKSIEGHALLGDALAARPGAKGALTAYGTAINLYKQKYQGPKYEDPDYLYARVAQIMRENPPKGLIPQNPTDPMPAKAR